MNSQNLLIPEVSEAYMSVFVLLGASSYIDTCDLPVRLVLFQ